MIVDSSERVERADWLARVEQALADGFTWFDWLGGVDESPRGAEFTSDGTVDVHLQLRHPGTHEALLLVTRVAPGEALPSVTPLLAGAAFCEREVHEMFAVEVEGFEDGTGLGVRRLLLSDDFEGAPLRKDFVLQARQERPWPGGIEPGESRATAGGRRRHKAPGVVGSTDRAGGRR